MVEVKKDRKAATTASSGAKERGREKERSKRRKSRSESSSSESESGSSSGSGSGSSSSGEEGGSRSGSSSSSAASRSPTPKHVASGKAAAGVKAKTKDAARPAAKTKETAGSPPKKDKERRRSAEKPRERSPAVEPRKQRTERASRSPRGGRSGGGKERDEPPASKPAPRKPARSPTPPPKQTRLSVGHLTRNVIKEHLTEIFSVYGGVRSVDMPRDHNHQHLGRGFAYVEYEAADDAEKALKHMDGGQIDGQEVSVQFVLRPPAPSPWSGRAGGRGGAPGMAAPRRRTPPRRRHEHWLQGQPFGVALAPNCEDGKQCMLRYSQSTHTLSRFLDVGAKKSKLPQAKNDNPEEI